MRFGRTSRYLLTFIFLIQSVLYNGLVVYAPALAMNQVAAFKGNVKSIYTHTLVDKEAERVFPGWQDHFEEWEKVGSDRPYHYLGSAIWFNRIGHAFADEMLVLLKNANSKN